MLQAKRFLFPVFILAFALFGLAACGEKEPEQRAAFIALLEENIINQPGVAVPELSSEQRKTIGDYDKHYDLLLNFQKKLNKDLHEKFDADLQAKSLKTLEQAVSKRDDLADVIKRASEARGEVTELLAKTDKEKADLKQPSDLKVVYDRAYEKVVSKPATTFGLAIEKMEATFASVLSLVDFIRENREGLTIDGQNVKVLDESLQPELDRRSMDIQRNMQELLKAYQEVSATAM